MQYDDWLHSIMKGTIMNDYEIIGEIAFELCLILSFISLDEILARKKEKQCREKSGRFDFDGWST